MYLPIFPSPLEVESRHGRDLILSPTKKDIRPPRFRFIGKRRAPYQRERERERGGGFFLFPVNRSSTETLVIPREMTAKKEIPTTNGAIITTTNNKNNFLQDEEGKMVVKNKSEAETEDEEEARVWEQIRQETRRDAEAEPALASYLYSTVLSHSSLERSLAFHIGNRLCSSTLLSTLLYDLFLHFFSSSPSLRSFAVADLRATRLRDPACASFSHCLLNYKGFLALQAHRVSHRLWLQGRSSLALALQSRVSDVFAVDIHPGARIGSGILLDHATGVVIGETAVVGNNVSILHHVTLGGTGKDVGDRHPKVSDGVLIGAGATILGNVNIGEGAKIGAGSVVLIDVPPWTTAVGNPARLVGGRTHPTKNNDLPGETMDHTSFIVEWSDYVI